MDESESAPFSSPQPGPDGSAGGSAASEPIAMSLPLIANDLRRLENDEASTIFAREIPDPLRTPDSPQNPDTPQAPDSPQAPDAPRTSDSPSSPDSPPAPDSPPSQGLASLPDERFGFVQPGNGTFRTFACRTAARDQRSETSCHFHYRGAADIDAVRLVRGKPRRLLAPDPLEIARAQLIDLDQGRWRAAYDLFFAALPRAGVV